MSLTIDLLLARNQNWAAHARRNDANYFKRHCLGQSPRCLWIGCADSRVPAENLVQARPGELFVLRNVGNQVLPNDVSVMSGVHYALTTLGVNIVIICGHTHCGGVMYASQMAAMAPDKQGQWGEPLQRQLGALSDFLRQEIKSHPDWQNLSTEHFQRRMVELNILQQVHQLQQTSLVQQICRVRQLEIYGCIYEIGRGELHVLSRDKG